jgi:hypothetical protein
MASFQKEDAECKQAAQAAFATQPGQPAGGPGTNAQWKDFFKIYAQCQTAHGNVAEPAPWAARYAGTPYAYDNPYWYAGYPLFYGDPFLFGYPYPLVFGVGYGFGFGYGHYGHYGHFGGGYGHFGGGFSHASAGHR